MFVFFNNLFLLGKIQSSIVNIESYHPWTDFNRSYCNDFKYSSECNYLNEFAKYDEDGLKYDQIEENMRLIDNEDPFYDKIGEVALANVREH